jgi:diaminopimelate decarboxylase
MLGCAFNTGSLGSLRVAPQAGRRKPQALTTLPCFCRRQQNVDETVQALQAKGLQVKGVVCHVGNAQDRTQLIKQAIQAG